MYQRQQHTSRPAPRPSRALQPHRNGKLMSCPLCGSYFPPGYGHACVARAPLPSNICENGCVLLCRCAPRPKKRTICADCRHHRTEMDWSRYPSDRHLCGHENARNLITGKPTECSTRNLGNCPDYQEKQP